MPGAKAPRSAQGKRVPRKDSLLQHRYGSIRILRDGRVRASAEVNPAVEDLDFSIRYGAALGDGTYVRDMSSPTIHARCPGNTSFFLLYLSKHRIQSACFDFTLSPEELRKAVARLRRAGGGIEGWIVPGLEWTQAALSRTGTNPDALKVIPELLDSVRDLPVALPWKRQKQEWERLEQDAGNPVRKEPRNRKLSPRAGAVTPPRKRKSRR